jgi:hypothetical protein
MSTLTRSRVTVKYAPASPGRLRCGGAPSGGLRRGRLGCDHRARSRRFGGRERLVRRRVAAVKPPAVASPNTPQAPQPGASTQPERALEEPFGATWEALLARYAPSGLAASAKEQGALVRRRQIASASVLLRLAMAYALMGSSLREVCAWAALQGIAFLSHVALRNRVRKAQPWLSHLVAEQLRQSSALREGEAVLGQGPVKRIVLQDASVICGPASHGTDFRVHVGLDLAKQWLAQAEVTDGKGGETLARLAYPAGTLVVGDRIYGTRQSLWALHRAGSFALVRINRTNLPLQTPEGQAVDILEEARRCPEGGVLDLALQTAPSLQEALPSIPVRLLVLRLSAEAAERARRRCRKEAQRKGHTPSQETLEAQDYLLLVTTLDAEVLPVEVALALYRLRWQVEICFKQSKSLLALDDLRVQHNQIGQAVLCTKLLAILWLGEACAQWSAAFAPDLAQQEGVMLPRWRMLHRLWDGFKLALGWFVSMQEWLEAPKEVRRRLAESPCKRTKERNERLQATLGALGMDTLC